MKNVKQQSGFTLIELVVVIVILGILAATAAPRFIDLQADAQTSTLNAVRGAMQSASNLVYSKALIDGTANGAATTDVNGDTISTTNRYPSSSAAAATTSWGNLLDEDGFTITSIVASSVTDFVDGTYIVYYPDNITGTDIPDALTDNCFAWFLESQAINTAPTTGVVDCI